MTTANPDIAWAATGPDVSIIMSVYNDGRWLSTTLDAMLAQTHANLEIIVLDDASTDDTPQILSRYTDARIRKIRNESRSGWLANMNRMAGLARGELLKLHCPDDVMDATGVACALALYRRHPELGYIFSDHYCINESGKRMLERPVRPYDEVIAPHVADEIGLHEGCFVNTSCLYVPRNTYLSVGGMRDVTRYNPQRWPNVEDYDLMVRLQERHPAGYIPAQLVAVRAHHGQVQINKTAQLLSLEGAVFIYRNLAQRLAAADGASERRVRAALSRKIARDHFQFVVKSALRGEWSHAWKMLQIIREAMPMFRLIVSWTQTSVLPALGRRVRRLMRGFSNVRREASR